MRKNSYEHTGFFENLWNTPDNVDFFIFAAHPVTDEILFANKAFCERFGADCIGKKSSAFIHIRRLDEEGAFLPSGCEGSSSIWAGNSPSDSSELFGAYLESSGLRLSVNWELIPWAGGEFVYLIHCHDITAQRRHEEHIRAQAFFDYLTGLPNRFRCDLELKKSLEHSRISGRPGFALFTDLDDFKIVNDTYGHGYGDGVLISFAGYLRELFSGGNNVFRFGGDEFVIIVTHDQAWRLPYFLESLLERAKKPWTAGGKEFYCSLSIGVVEFSGGEDAQSILQKADIAMYKAKKSGKNSYAMYAEGLDKEALQRSEMEALLRHSIENNFQGFKILYQPYCSMKDGRIAGAEALIRMLAPSGALILPDQFIALAEYLGFMDALDEHVLREAAKECVRIHSTGRRDFSITVKISGPRFKRTDMASTFRAVLESAGVDFSGIIVSLNENAVIDDLERVHRLCEEFRALGIRVALDGFGTGSSSFMNLRNLAVDIIKVSSRYIDTYDDEFSGSFLKLVADLAHFTRKQVCINGVETQEQLDFCETLGIEMVQGFHLYLPGPAETLEQVLKDAC